MALKTTQAHIDAARELLERPLRQGPNKLSVNGLMEVQLYKRGLLTQTFSWGHYHYDIAVVRSGKLTPDARAWCEANGLKAEADVYEAWSVGRKAMARREDLRKLRVTWAERRAIAERELAKIDAELVELDQMLGAADV